MIAHEGFGLSKFISYGNAIDLDEVDILDYLAKDKETKVIVFYMEGVKRGKDFIEVAKRATLEKPVIVIKGGTTEAGATAAHSHTASLAGNYEAYEAVFKQFGIIKAESLDDLLNFSKIFDTQPLAKGNRVAIITNGGGTGAGNGFPIQQQPGPAAAFKGLKHQAARSDAPDSQHTLAAGYGRRCGRQEVQCSPRCDRQRSKC
jgi:acetyl-CoA synthetase (ADP-forming) alpha subunit (EC 6.2.1.13)/branched-chain acyl-CoA synthetase (ADP-forming) alpha subunit (EC 6.2.1.-)/aryl-CoA synthetase (ADP-forming) alpha subunit (EC 6.2.1.-)